MWYNTPMIIKNERKHYASDLTDSQWAMIAPLFPPAGHKSKWEKRELVDAVLYLVENGCKCRNLPHDFPPYTTVSNFYHAAVKSGLWEKLLAALVAQTREQADKRSKEAGAFQHDNHAENLPAYHSGTGKSGHRPCNAVTLWIKLIK